MHGGTTTLIDFVQCVHERTIQQSIERRRRTWKDACYCDYGFHLTLMGEVPTPHFGQLADAMQDGHASIKIFTTNIRPGNVGRMVPHGHIWEALKVVAGAGGIACIHAEDNDIVMFMYEKLMRENRVSFEHMAEVHNALSRGALLQPRDPAGRERRGRGALHGACLGGDRRGGARRRRAPAASRCTAKPCTST